MSLSMYARVLMFALYIVPPLLDIAEAIGALLFLQINSLLNVSAFLLKDGGYYLGALAKARLLPMVL